MTPDTIAGWKALAQGLLSQQPCVFHRNLEISSRYAEAYGRLPSCLKWAGMAAFASHHVRLALLPFRLDAEGMLRVPTGPGLGVRLNRDALGRYTGAGARH